MTALPAGQVEDLGTIRSPDQAPKRGRSRRTAGEGRLAFFLIAPTMALLTLVVGYPIVKAVYQSFLSDQGLVNGFFNKGGSWVGLNNYKYWLLERCGSVHCPPGTFGSQFYESVWFTVF